MLKATRSHLRHYIGNTLAIRVFSAARDERRCSLDHARDAGVQGETNLFNSVKIFSLSSSSIRSARFDCWCFIAELA
jgi:hypothetical protein